MGDGMSSLPEGRAPITDKDLADLTRRLAETAIERNCRCEELEAENERLRQLVASAAKRMNRSAAIIMRDLDDPRILRASLKQNRSD